MDSKTYGLTETQTRTGNTPSILIIIYVQNTLALIQRYGLRKNIGIQPKRRLILRACLIINVADRVAYPETGFVM